MLGPKERANLETSTFQGRSVRWIVLAPGDDLEKLARRRVPPDLMVGAPAALFESLAAQGLLEPAEPGGPAWRVVSRRKVGMARSRSAPKAALAFDDPRADRISLAWMEAQLRPGSWAEGYAALVHQAGGARSPGRQPGAALAAVERGEASMAPAVPTENSKPGWDFEPLAPWEIGVAVVRGAPHAAEARALAEELSGSLEAPQAPTMSPEARSLLADLLGATVVEAHEELVAAHSALEVSKPSEAPRKWMTQAPPWPPASVAKMLAEPGGMPMVETLAAEIAPEPAVRGWLLRSWLAPPRLIDGPLIDELAGAAEGRLAREPRFRAWLRSEWTAWARQRYRRVARTASGEWTPPGPGTGASS